MDTTSIPFEAGQSAEEDVDITEQLVNSFAEYSGDYNPLHIDADFASRTPFRRKVAHGLSYGALFSRLIGLRLPGPGALWASQNFRFERPVFVGDRLKLRVEITRVSQSTRTMTMDCTATNQNEERVLSGTGEVVVLEQEAEAEIEASRENRIALVAGASRGIGAAVAERLNADGFSVAVTYRASREEAEKLVAGFHEGMAIQADMADPESAQTALASVQARFGKAPDTLVLCASDPALYGASADGDFRLFSRHWDTQMAGSHAFVSACLDDMVTRGFGVITAIGSTYAKAEPPTGMAPYVVAKAALAAYIKCLAVEFGPKGIRANTVAPGMTETALIASVPDRHRKVAAAQTPLRRLAKPADVAGAVSYLVSDDAAYVNGHTLLVSGGGTM
jgi:3-oxoacyl-[acyl-carrier protein] reductase